MPRAHCPKCGADVSDSYEPDDPSVGIVGGFYCDACDLGVSEDHAETFDDDAIEIERPPPREPLGTPISELSGRPGERGFDEFCRIARSWGFE